MASCKYSTAEKGKQIDMQARDPDRNHIRASEIDTSALIKDNELTLIGRVTNAKEQPIGSLISSLPRNCLLKGRVTG